MKPRRMKIPDRWTFRSREVAAAFDAHVREQLPWYDLATGIVVHIARHYVSRKGTIIDVGAATGNMELALRSLIDDRAARLVPFDSSAAMKDVYRGKETLIIADAVGFDFASHAPDLIICFLTMMFLSSAERGEVIGRMKRALRPGGAIIVFDKMEPRSGYLGVIAYRLTLAAKHEAGAPPAEIIAKELSLAGVQRPLAASEMIGFEEMFRFGDFAGFVWEKREP